MTAIIKREIRNYLKRPLFWLGIMIVIFGVFQQLEPYLNIHYITSEKEIANDYPDAVPEADVYDGYIPASEAERRVGWENEIRETLTAEFGMSGREAEAVIESMSDMTVEEACRYLRDEYGYYGAINAWENSAYRKGTKEEINAYIESSLEEHPFSYYFSRKFADFTGLFMGFLATVLLAFLFMQDMRKNTYELLHTKPVSPAQYVIGKTAGGFLVCLLILGIMNLVFYTACRIYTADAGFEVRLVDFIGATCLYILPNMLMIVCVYALISLLFKNPLPAVPLLVLYILYSNMGSRNADGVFGYYGRPLAIMVRFPGMFFDTAPPPMALLNQCFLVIASIGVIVICMRLWRRRKI